MCMLTFNLDVYKGKYHNLKRRIYLVSHIIAIIYNTQYETSKDKTHLVLYTNMDQTLMNSLHRLLNCEISGLDC